MRRNRCVFWALRIVTGFDGVDQRIDVLATAMQAGIKAPELACLDLAYAPPYSSAKDPVNMAGFIAENIETGEVKQFRYEDLADLRSRPGVMLLDTRTVGEYAAGHAEGFINIPLDSLRDRLAELDAHQPGFDVHVSKRPAQLSGLPYP